MSVNGVLQECKNIKLGTLVKIWLPERKADCCREDSARCAGAKRAELNKRHVCKKNSHSRLISAKLPENEKCGPRAQRAKVSKCGNPASADRPVRVAKTRCLQRKARRARYLPTPDLARAEPGFYAELRPPKAAPLICGVAGYLVAEKFRCRVARQEKRHVKGDTHTVPMDS